MPDLNPRPNRYRVQFPKEGDADVPQDEAYFHLMEDGEKLTLRLHDYDRIYRRPGLYEQVVYDRLKCSSPKKVGEILKRTLDGCQETFSELRVLDLGAGNGIMGEILNQHGVARMVAVDIAPEAKEAALRDRPGLYDDYYVTDLTTLSPQDEKDIRAWSINCLTAVAALGFGDIPPEAFFKALQLVEVGGWVAFNIKETFLDHADTSGFSHFIRELIFSEYLDVYHLEKYRHRLSIEGAPLFYFALVARRTSEIPDSFLTDIGVE